MTVPVDGLLPPQVHSVARPGEDDGKDALVGEEVEREAPATGATVTHPNTPGSSTILSTRRNRREKLNRYFSRMIDSVY